MTPQDTRILALAQSIYQARHNQQNDVDGEDLTNFLDETIEWVNQLTPEIDKARDPSGRAVDWNHVRTNDAIIGTVTVGTTVSYALPSTVRKLVINPHRDLTIRYGSTIVSTFKLVNPNQTYDPRGAEIRNTATVLQRKVIFSRPLNATEVTGSIVADTVGYFPTLTHSDVSLLDLLDADYDMRQAYVFGVLKNQILPDIVQGGLTPSYAQKFDSYLADCIAANNESSTADEIDREDLSYIHGVSF